MSEEDNTKLNILSEPPFKKKSERSDEIRIQFGNIESGFRGGDRYCAIAT